MYFTTPDGKLAITVEEMLGPQKPENEQNPVEEKTIMFNESELGTDSRAPKNGLRGFIRNIAATLNL